MPWLRMHVQRDFTNDDQYFKPDNFYRTIIFGIFNGRNKATKLISGKRILRW